MKHYVEFDIETGRIIRRGECQSQHIPIPRRLNAIALIRADYKYNAIVCDEINDGKIAVNPKLTKKSFDRRRPKPITILEGERPAQITNEQWQSVLDRLDKLDTRSIKAD